jgi:type III pantothenate kinase
LNLAIDIGNTRAKAGLFSEGKLVRTQSWENWSFADFYGLAANLSVKNIIFSTVSHDLPADAGERFRNHFRCLELSADTPLPIGNSYETPETLGKDRLAAVCGAYALFPAQACLVVDAGTCITYDWLDAAGTYQGGNIAPGLDMRLRAMHAFTARLPKVAVGALPHWIGKSTETALRNGAQLGALMELEGYLQKSEAEFGSLVPLITGGDANFLAKHTKRKIFVNHHLVLIGLNQILDYNVKRLE